MSKAAYIPERGHVIWTNFTPQAGREQAGKRPALVLSKRSYNLRSGLAICCPITSKIKGFPFEVRIAGGKLDGVILADHVKSIDLKARGATFAGQAPSDAVDTVCAMLSGLIGKV